MIAIIDYGMGNLRSVEKAFQHLGEEAMITSDPQAIRDAERLVLPGVGSFPDAMERLRRLGLVEVLGQEVLEKRKPFLGICLGMQLIAKRGHENGGADGLGWVDAEVRRLEAPDGLKIPHVGWNALTITSRENPLKQVPDGADVYFVHSYAMRVEDPAIVAATCKYGAPFVAAIQKENIFATQFHPEKSQTIGIGILSDFAEWRAGGC